MSTPLVSVVVITYNSAKTVIDTLDSIYNQTYPNIELIISDDCSKDNTVELCEEWLKVHRDRFVDAKLLSSEKNQGTVKNANKGIKASSGEWVKGFAGDDKLIPEAIQKYLDFCASNEQCKMCVSDMELFSDEEDVPEGKIRLWESFYKNINVPPKKQWKDIRKNLYFTGPSYFFNRTLYDKVGGFDENYILMDEWPFCYKVLEKGYRIYAIPEKLVRYRVSSNSVCNYQKRGLGNKQLFKDYRRFFYKTRLPKLLANGELLYAYCSILSFEIENLMHEHPMGYKPCIIFLKLINPSWWRRLLLPKETD